MLFLLLRDQHDWCKCQRQKRPRRHAQRFKLGNQRHGVTWKNAGLEFVFSPGADVRSVIKQFGKLLRDVGPLLELGEIIFKQLERRPLNATTSMKLYMPMPMIDGMPVKQWLQSRERAALDIDPATAKIAYTAEQLFDPYGVYPEVPERYRYSVRDHFVCSPDRAIRRMHRRHSISETCSGVRAAIEKMSLPSA